MLVFVLCTLCCACTVALQIGGVFAADPHAKAAACNVVCAMIGMGLMYVAISWMVMDVACQVGPLQALWAERSSHS